MTQAELKETFNKAYHGSYYTITGAAVVDHDDWKKGYKELLRNHGIGDLDTDRCVSFTGKDMNEFYHLTGDNAYPDELGFLAFPNDGLHTGLLAKFKIMMNDRWFDDIVDNNASRGGFDQDRAEVWSEYSKETWV